jgi:hypothetical protein
MSKSVAGWWLLVVDVIITWDWSPRKGKNAHFCVILLRSSYLAAGRAWLVKKQ